MITKDTKISEMLKQFPDTLEVMVKASPHFNKLKNKILRKALAGRVTVEQAALIAGISLEELLKELNLAAGKLEEYLTMDGSKNKIDSKSSTGILSKDDIKQLEKIKTNILVELDVRDDIAAGHDPFKKIIQTVKQLKDNEVLHLINTFEPVPLYTVLKNRGYSHLTEAKNGIYNVYFFKDLITEKSKGAADSKKSSDNIEITGDENVVEIDVRGLEPPEPMVKILEELSALDNNSILLVHHHREPVMLYEKLEERGFKAITNKIDKNYFKVLIAKKSSGK